MPYHHKRSRSACCFQYFASDGIRCVNNLNKPKIWRPCRPLHHPGHDYDSGDPGKKHWIYSLIAQNTQNREGKGGRSFPSSKPTRPEKEWLRSLNLLSRRKYKMYC